MGHRFAVAATETLTGTRTLTVAEVEAADLFSFDPGGAGRNLDLPAEASCTGILLHIANLADAAETITVRDDGAATIATVAQNERAVVWCDGTQWMGGVVTIT